MPSCSTDRLFRLRRLAAIWLGVLFSLVMTLGVCVLSMELRRSGSGWHLMLAIGGSFWLQIATVLAALNGSRSWPAVLVFLSMSIYIAVTVTLSTPPPWAAGAFWLAACIVAGLGARQIYNHDVRGMAAGQRPYRGE
ncbi:hypothetical protein SAMN05216330_1352 [Bradyrhizobium sp. Ghvi]|nr:hypothetical protein SAMN05216330_1352 [Bradyrhizobium sp. Ghvi]